MREEVLDCHYVTLRVGAAHEARLVVVEHDGAEKPLSDCISESGIIINGTYQDTNNPIDYVLESEKDCLKPGCLIIDVSCDEGMGFYFAKPTTFKAPMFQVEKVDYYAVDHTPSYFWESATRSISAALLVHLPAFAAGRDSWLKSETLRRAINIEEGVIQKAGILSFQNREPAYPHVIIRR